MPDDPKHPMFWVAPLLLVVVVFFVWVTGAPIFGMGREEVRVQEVPSEAPKLLPTLATVLVAGDMMFDRSVRMAMDAQGEDFIFSCIKDTLQSADLVVANLEGPITNNASVSVGSVVDTPENYTFTFAPGVAALLHRHNIKLVNLGNNHILNFGQSGEDVTKEYLRVAGVEYFGDTKNNTVAYSNVQGVRIAFINYNEFAPGGWRGSASTTLAQITEERARGFLPVVYTHWGDEYKTTAPERLQTLARQFVDAGAEMVIGSHPHVVEQSELYSGKHIYYSLGNFVFDQYFLPEVQRGLLLSITFAPGGVLSVTEIPTILSRDRRVCVATQ